MLVSLFFIALPFASQNPRQSGLYRRGLPRLSRRLSTFDQVQWGCRDAAGRVCTSKICEYFYSYCCLLPTRACKDAACRVSRGVSRPLTRCNADAETRQAASVQPRYANIFTPIAVCCQRRPVKTRPAASLEASLDL
jgi:hypothetical protein